MLLVRYASAAHRRQWQNAITTTALKAVARQTVAAVADAPHAWVATILLTDNAQVQQYNAQYRQQDKPTNVLSFPDGSYDDQQRINLGDCMLAWETVWHEAQQQHKSIMAHTTHLVVHGMLHLLNYNHDDEYTANIMEALEISILQQLGIANPYIGMDASENYDTLSPHA